MFRRQNKLPHRKQFCLSKEEIIEDIKNVYDDENQRRKLYLCIEEKMPVLDKKFKDIQMFLQSTNGVDRDRDKLNSKIAEMLVLNEQLAEEVNTVKQNLERISKDCILKDKVYTIA